jgi:aflatoxin B1 aldehyde reductase
MATPPRTRLVFGAGGIGEGTITHAWTTGEQTSELLIVLKELKMTELDSAASSPPGSPRVSERLLGESRAAGRGFVIDTKIERTATSGGLSEAAIDSSLKKSLELLGVKQCNILYAHFPDPNTPVEESARAFDKHYRAGLFREVHPQLSSPLPFGHLIIL